MKKFFVFFLCLSVFAACTTDSDLAKSSVDASSSSVQNGSYSKVIVIGDFMYAVDAQNLYTIDVSDPQNPVQLSTQAVGSRIETIYHYYGVLFIGSGEALYIYDIKKDGLPTRLSRTAYEALNDDMQPCDPVVASGDHAYVTLSTSVLGEGPCGNPRMQQLNELHVYDVADLTNPKLAFVQQMNQPKGLATDGNLLFVCDSNQGLKVFDITNPEVPVQIQHFSGFNAYDVITKDGLLVVVGPDDLYQYDYSDINDMKLLSSVKL